MATTTQSNNLNEHLAGHVQRIRHLIDEVSDRGINTDALESVTAHPEHRDQFAFEVREALKLIDKLVKSSGTQA